jgi:GAF domain-containing protein
LFGFDLHEFESRVIPVEELNDSLRSALVKGETLVQEDGIQQHISIPILLRGQVLGAIALTLPLNRPVTRRQMEMISSVVQRLALALENKRLFEQSQSQAQRESRANEIAALLLSTTDVEAVMSLAANRFNEALGAIQTRIHLTGSTVNLPNPQEEQA